MKDDLILKNGIIIPGHELEITASRSGGPGGQHVNKTSSRITVRWNVAQTTALDEEHKKRILAQLASELTSDGDLIVHYSASRSQQQNKQTALAQLERKIMSALHIPKKRIKAAVPKAVKEARFTMKKRHSARKKMRAKIFHDD